MDPSNTKRKHPFRVWLCFFLGVNILAGFLTIVPLALMNSDVQENKDEIYNFTVNSDLYKTTVFKTTLMQTFDALLECVKSNPDANDTASSYQHINVSSSTQRLDNEGENAVFYVKNPDGEIVYDTMNDADSLIRYNYLLLVENNKLQIYEDNNGNALDMYLSGDMKAHSVTLDRSYDALKERLQSFRDETPKSQDAVVLMAIRTDLQNISSSEFYHLFLLHLIIRLIALACIILFLLGIALLVFSTIKRREKNRFLLAFAKVTSHIWLEFKLASIVLCVMGMYTLLHSLQSSYWSDFALNVICVAGLIAGLWFFYFVIKDIKINGTNFFKKNSINFIIGTIRRLTNRLRFEKRMITRFWIFIGVEAILLLLVLASSRSGPPALFFAAIFILYFSLFVRDYFTYISDTGKLVTQIMRIKSGNLSMPIALREKSCLYEYAESLNTLQNGMSAAVDRQLASERMKIELITNVSHDLKTPLTSIIGYIDLLEKEDLSSQADAYVKILSQKSQRLKSMIQDIFDVSKASSGNLIVQKQDIDLVRLVEQTIADMNERIDSSGLDIRFKRPDNPLMISSDGQKLYRVFQNLIDNALRYSLPGSRVYIRLHSDEKNAVAEIKNTSAFDLDFKPGEITERFVRGDKARSGEGSGLGLSIAKSYTEACGGTFKITIEDDVFKAALVFPLYQQPLAAKQPEPLVSMNVPDNIAQESGVAAAEPLFTLDEQLGDESLDVPSDQSLDIPLDVSLDESLSVPTDIPTDVQIDVLLDVPIADNSSRIEPDVIPHEEQKEKDVRPPTTNESSSLNENTANENFVK